MPLYVLNFLPSYIIVSPGDSFVPAINEPNITQLAPAAIALTISPVYLTPPSAINGTSVPAKIDETSRIADN